MKILFVLILAIFALAFFRPDIIVGGTGSRQLSATGQVKFTQEILPAPKLPKATTQYIQQSAPKEYWQNTARP
jgi:hypothetical protein